MFPAGWYPDQADHGLLRYWDGQRWTHHTRPSYPAPAAALARAADRTRVPAWQSWWVIVLGLLLCFPIGLVGLWKRPGLSTNLRWILTGCTAGLLVLALALPDTPEPEPTRDRAAAAPPSSTPATTRPADAADSPASTAPAPVLVPDLTGLSRDDARAALERLGLVLGEVTSKPSRRAADTVLRQTLPTGTEAIPGEAVDVVLATPLPAVPDVQGLRQARAVKLLRQAGFVPDVSTRVTRTGADGVVLSQSPGAETRKKPGATIRIVVADVQIVPLA